MGQGAPNGNAAWKWKLVLTAFLFLLAFLTILVDFNDPPVPEWSRFEEGVPLPSANADGAKAALLAMLGAATLFIGLIPTKDNREVELATRIVGAGSVAAAGWFWLLSATEGRPGNYLLVMVPVMFLLAGLMAISLISGVVQSYGEKAIQGNSTLRLPWRLLSLVAMALIAAVTIFALFFLPGWLRL